MKAVDAAANATGHELGADKRKGLKLLTATHPHEEMEIVTIVLDGG